MAFSLPTIDPVESTPLVRQLLDIIHQQQLRIELLEQEILRLKRLPARPDIAPSDLEAPTRPPPQPGQKRPGSAKRAKTQALLITHEVLVPLPDVPADATFKGYEDFVVQELLIRPQITRYRRERWLFPDGSQRLADLPAEVLPGSHFGPELLSFLLHQYHHQHVSQGLLLEQVRQLGIDMSAGQLNRILTEGQDAFHQEKAELLPAGLQVSAYVQADDTAAPHDGQPGYCTHIGNELFAFFHSGDGKSRLDFLQLLRGAADHYVVDEAAAEYYRRQKLSGTALAALSGDPGTFADQAAWQAHLARHNIRSPRALRIATEGALLAAVLASGVSPELVIVSDAAGQFDILNQALCWLHAERPLARLVPFNEQHRQALEGVRSRIWELYQGLKAYRLSPTAAARRALGQQFDALVEGVTGYPSLDGPLKELAGSRAKLLRVLERPEVPLHNNLSEGHIRDFVRKRKVSGPTRSDAGRRARDTFASLKKTCRRLGVNFWEYLCDRVRGLGQLPRLATLLRQKAEELSAKSGLAASSVGDCGGAAA
jgi:hypothetical protein